MLTIATPIFVPWFNKNLFLGQSSPNIWHNPTHLMIKAVAFPILVWVAAIFDGVSCRDENQVPNWFLFAAPVCLVLSALAKPSFLQIFLPAVFLMMLYKLFRFRGVAIKPIMVLIVACVPALCVVAVQFWLSICAPGGDGAGFEIAFLKLSRHYSPNVFVSVLLVSLFPVFMFVYSLVKRDFRSSDALAWLTFFVGSLQSSFLIEKGRRMWHGNFSWGYALGVFFIWFFAMDKFMTLVLEDERPQKKWWFYCAVVILVLHVLSGICYLWRLLIWRMWT